MILEMPKFLRFWLIFVWASLFFAGLAKGAVFLTALFGTLCLLEIYWESQARQRKDRE